MGAEADDEECEEEDSEEEVTDEDGLYGNEDEEEACLCGANEEGCDGDGGEELSEELEEAFD